MNSSQTVGKYVPPSDRIEKPARKVYGGLFGHVRKPFHKVAVVSPPIRVDSHRRQT